MIGRALHIEELRVIMEISDELMIAGVPSELPACIKYSAAFAALPEAFQRLVIFDMEQARP